MEVIHEVTLIDDSILAGFNPGEAKYMDKSANIFQRRLVGLLYLSAFEERTTSLRLDYALITTRLTLKTKTCHFKIM